MSVAPARARRASLRSSLRALAFLLALAPALTAQEPTPANAAPRPLALEDLLSWKGIRFPTISNDGRWMAYVLAPNEGDAELVVRGTAAGAAETRVAIGEPPS